MGSEKNWSVRYYCAYRFKILFLLFKCRSCCCYCINGGGVERSPGRERSVCSWHFLWRGIRRLQGFHETRCRRRPPYLRCVNLYCSRQQACRVTLIYLHTLLKAAHSIYLYSESDTIVVLKTFDDLRADLSVAGGFDKATVSAFVGENSTPLVQEFSQEASKKIFSSPIQKHVLFFTNKKSAYHSEIVNVYRTAAADFKGRALFINVPSTESK